MLERVDPEAAAVARKRHGGLAPWAKEPAAHGKLALTSGFALCEQTVLEVPEPICLPQTERWRPYADASLARQFDAWAWFDETHAVEARPTTPRPGIPETYPFGLQGVATRGSPAIVPPSCRGSRCARPRGRGRNP